MPCSSPLALEAVGGPVGCGRCRHCRRQKKQLKSTRLFFESKTHASTLFVTLTYNERFLPREYVHPVTGESYACETGVLSPRDTRLFTLRLTSALKRRFGSPFKFRYFYVGEYGETENRPHYHFIFFGLNKRDHEHIIRDCWSHPRTREPYCNPERLDVDVPRDEWHVSQYVACYMLKKSETLDRDAHRTPEFSRSSKGIGLPYVSDLLAALSTPSALSYIQRNADIPPCVLVNGKKLFFDRYMKGKLRAALQIEEMVKVVSQKLQSEDMQALFARARSNPSIPPRWFVEPKMKIFALQKQYIAEKAQQCAVDDARASFFSQKRKL